MNGMCTSEMMTSRLGAIDMPKRDRPICYNPLGASSAKPSAGLKAATVRPARRIVRALTAVPAEELASVRGNVESQEREVPVPPPRGAVMSARVLLVDDHQLVREGLKALLEREQFHVIAEASNGHDAIERARAVRPEVVVIDLAMPELNGLDAAQEIHRVSPSSKIVALTMHTEDHYVMSAVRAGINGYVLKSQASVDLLQAIREVSLGRIYLSPGISRAVVEAYLAKTELPPDPLSPRERTVLQLVAEGRTTKEIAQRLGISVKTADSHRTRIMSKLDIHGTAGLVRHAIRLGLIRP